MSGTQVEQTLGHFEHLKQQHHQVASKSRQLHDSCERLVRLPRMLPPISQACATALL